MTQGTSDQRVDGGFAIATPRKIRHDIVHRSDDSKRQRVDTSTLRGDLQRNSIQPYSRAPTHAPTRMTTAQSYRPESSSPFNKLTPANYRNGIIIQAPHFTSLMNKRIALNHLSRVDSSLGPICAKYRWMVALAVFPDHIIAVPITSHGGGGLRNLSRYLRLEHVGIKVEGQDFDNQSEYLPLEINKDEDVVWKPTPTSYVHITHRFNVLLGDTQGKDVRYCGVLTKGSFEQLFHLFKRQMQASINMRDIIDAQKIAPEATPTAMQFSVPLAVPASTPSNANSGLGPSTASYASKLSCAA